MIFDLNEIIKSFIRYSEFNDTITGLSFPDCYFFILKRLDQPEMYCGSSQDDTCHMCLSRGIIRKPMWLVGPAQLFQTNY